MTRILLLDGASYKGAAELYRHPPGINAPPPSLTGLALLAFLPSFRWVLPWSPTNKLSTRESVRTIQRQTDVDDLCDRPAMFDSQNLPRILYKEKNCKSKISEETATQVTF